MLWVLIRIASARQNLYCGYSLELPRRGNSNEYPQHRFYNEYPQHRFLWRNKQNYPLISPNTLLICSTALIRLCMVKVYTGCHFRLYLLDTLVDVKTTASKF